MLARQHLTPLLLLLLLLVCLFSPTKQTKLHLTQGPIVGVVGDDGEGGVIHSFKGIPYALPPVGDLRFKDPIPAGSWSEVRDGSVSPPVCPQVNLGQPQMVRGQEDCLYLNVFTPEPTSSNLPVMVWFHEGAFLVGGANQISPRPLVRMGVVLVTVHFRIGTLGFLSTEDSILPGNLGLKDQVLALRWVKDNIVTFGGDPEKVTIFGVSSGAASVHFLVLSPYAKDLFQRAILQSGSSLCSWSIRSDHRHYAARIGLDLNCKEAGSSVDSLDSQKLLECLRGASVEELVLAAHRFAIWSNEPIVMLPRVDLDFLPAPPAKLLKEGQFNKVDLISGVTKHEGALSVKYIYASKSLKDALVTNFTTIGPLVMNFRDGDDNPLYSSQRVFHKYIGDLDITEDKADSLVELFTDRLFKTCHEDTAIAHMAGSSPLAKVFLYTLTHRGQKGFSDQLEIGKHWVSHTDDKQYLFDDDLKRSGDLLVQDLMTTMWTNFAKTGDPTPDMSLGFRWKPMAKSCLDYLDLKPAAEMAVDRRAEIRNFFASLPTIQNKILHPNLFSPSTRPSC